VLDHEVLGDESAQGEGEDVDLVEAEGPDEGVGVVGPCLDAVGNVAGGGPDAALSNVMTWRSAAIGSTIRGSQLSRVAARCTKKTTGIPPFGPSSR
jgi:hypothetical protein